MAYFDNIESKKGTVHIVINRCKGCSYCIEYCPKDVLEMSDEFNKKGYHYPEAINEDNCIYCQLCEAICPEYAIFITEVERENLNKEE